MLSLACGTLFAATCLMSALEHVKWYLRVQNGFIKENKAFSSVRKLGLFSINNKD